eukprot:COSAG04_NODE_10367_length_783_cov_1.064327_1_plen_151_part_10
MSERGESVENPLGAPTTPEDRAGRSSGTIGEPDVDGGDSGIASSPAAAAGGRGKQAISAALVAVIGVIMLSGIFLDRENSWASGIYWAIAMVAGPLTFIVQYIPKKARQEAESDSEELDLVPDLLAGVGALLSTAEGEATMLTKALYAYMV